MSRVAGEPTSTQPGEAIVPLWLPASLPAPAPARRVGFALAMLMHWLLPARFGPHLAAGPSSRALGAHALSMAIVLPIGLAAWAASESNRSGSLLGIRVAAAEVLLRAEEASAGDELIALLIVAASVLLIEVGAVLVALVLVPWCAGGDAALFVFRRSLNNVWWGTSALVPLCIPCGLMVVNEDRWAAILRARSELLVGAMNLTAIAVPTIILLRVLLLGASRYVGPAAGPGFQRREPHCEACGYVITGLGAASACPECGRAVRDSFPGARTPDLGVTSAGVDGLLQTLRLQRQILFRPRVFERVAVLTQDRPARLFWWRTYLLGLLMTMLLLRVAASGLSLPAVVRMIMPATLLVSLAPLGLHAVMSTCAWLWGSLRHGITDARVASTITFYTAPCLWLIILANTALFIVGPAPSHARAWRVLALGMQPEDLWLVPAAAVLNVAMLGWWWWRVCRGLRDVRHANG